MKSRLNKHEKWGKQVGLGIILSLSATLIFNVVPAYAKTTVTFWELTRSPEEPIQKGTLKIIENFEKQHPDIEIKFVQIEQGDYYPKLIIAFKGENPPDVIRIQPFYNMIDCAKAGWLKPLDDLVAKSEYLDPEAWLQPQAYRWNGKLWALPNTINLRRIAVNKNVYRKFGLTRPTTWDQLLANAKKATKGGTYGWGSVLYERTWAIYQFGNILAMNNADVVAPDFKTVTVSERPFVEALEFYAELNSKYGLPGVVSMEPEILAAAFATDRLAMYSMGTWWKTANYDVSHPDFKYREDYISILNPSGPERLRNLDLPRTAAVGDAWGWAFAAQAPHPEEGWKFLEFLTRPSNRVLYNYEAPNSTTEVELMPERWKTPWWRDYQETMRYPIRPPIQPFPGVLETYEVVTDGIKAAILGKKSVEQVVSELETQIEEIIQKSI